MTVQDDDSQTIPEALCGARRHYTLLMERHRPAIFHIINKL